MEGIELDIPTKFSEHKLNGLLLADDFASIVSKGFEDVEFCHLLHDLCVELKVLYDLEESPYKIDSVSEVKTFLYELSVFLMELECSLDEITVGSLEERFNTPEKRFALIFFLISELKCARCVAAVELQKPVEVVPDKPLVTTVCNAMKTLGVSTPQPGGDISQIIGSINVEIGRRLQSCSTRPTPIFTSQMNEYKWSTVDQICHQLAADCYARNLLLVKRIDVTVNSFLWCERVRKNEAEIRSLFVRRREDMSKIKSPDAASLLAATTDILRIEQASSSRLRRNTKLRFHSPTNGEQPKDRGGRTKELILPRNETYSQQRGRGGKTWGNKGQGKHVDSGAQKREKGWEKQIQSYSYQQQRSDREQNWNRTDNFKNDPGVSDNSYRERHDQKGGRRQGNYFKKY